MKKREPCPPLPCNRRKDSRKGRKQGEKFHLAVLRSGVFESADELWRALKPVVVVVVVVFPRISSRIMLITKHGVATTSVLPRAPRCFDDRRRAASSVISSRRERVRKNRAGMDGTRSAGGGDTTTRATSSGRNRFIRHSTARRSALLSDETRSIHGTNWDGRKYNDRSVAVYRYVGIGNLIWRDSF